MVADPLYYYPYLREEYIEDIAILFAKYIQTVDYEERTNLMSVDILGNYLTKEEKSYYKRKYLGKNSKGIDGVNKSIDLRCFISNLSQIQLRKAVYSDLDEVYNLLVKKLGYNKKDAYKKISAAFSSYSIYIYKIRGNIIGFFFLVPRLVAKDRDIMILSIEELYLKYRKYLVETLCLLEGFCSFFLSKGTFSNQFISVQSRDNEFMGFLGKSMGSNLSKITKESYNNCPTIFFTKTATNLNSFLYLDDTDYQIWLHRLYSSKQDKLLNPLLNHSCIFKKCDKEHDLFITLSDPEEYLGKTIVT